MKGGGVMCILIIIWIQQVQTHEGVLAAVTALPDLIKRWPELICIEEATAAGASSKAFWYVDVFLIQPNYWKILPVLGPTCQPFICFCFHLVLCSTHLSTSRLIGVSTSESTCWTLPFSPTAPLAPSHLFSLGVFLPHLHYLFEPCYISVDFTIWTSTWMLRENSAADEGAVLITAAAPGPHHNSLRTESLEKRSGDVRGSC